MNVSEAATLLSNNEVDQVCFSSDRYSGNWLCYLYGDKMPSSVVNAIQTEQHDTREWPSLDSLVQFIDELGCKPGVQKIVDTGGKTGKSHIR